jgi:hypothetical protein
MKINLIHEMSQLRGHKVEFGSYTNSKQNIPTDAAAPEGRGWGKMDTV